MRAIKRGISFETQSSQRNKETQMTQRMKYPLTRATVLAVISVMVCTALAWNVSAAIAGGSCGNTEPNPALLGCDNNTSISTTVFNASGFGASAIRGNATGGVTAAGLSGKGDYGAYGEGTIVGVQGKSADGTGVLGHSAAGVGVQGTSDSYIGVFAAGPRVGVYGQGNQEDGIGVDGYASTGTGVQAATSSGTALSVFGNRGTALSVSGKAKFSRSGILTIAAGTASKTVTMAGVTAASMVLATAQQSTTVTVKAAVPAAGSFKIVLTGNAPAGGLKVAYFVLN